MTGSLFVVDLVPDVIFAGGFVHGNPFLFFQGVCVVDDYRTFLVPYAQQEFFTVAVEFYMGSNLTRFRL